jgi:hypothetical protein
MNVNLLKHFIVSKIQTSKIVNKIQTNKTVNKI